MMATSNINGLTKLISQGLVDVVVVSLWLIFKSVHISYQFIQSKLFVFNILISEKFIAHICESSTTVMKISGIIVNLVNLINLNQCKISKITLSLGCKT